MSKINRIHQHIMIDIKTAQSLISKYDTSLKVEFILLIENGMSTSNYCVIANNRKYLLKIYPHKNDHSLLEIAGYRYAKKHIDVPCILLFDNSKMLLNNTFAVFEFIEGETLKEYAINNNGFDEKIIYKLGQTLALLHQKTYNHAGILNNDLSIFKEISPLDKQYEELIYDIAGTHLSNECKMNLLDFIKKNNDLLKDIAKENVFSHADFSFSNILIDNDGMPWIIDFEYAFSTSKYYDIGKFFREKSVMVQAYINDSVYNCFYMGYNSLTKNKLPNDWFIRAKLADITAMLGLINRENAPQEWIREIDDEIRATLNIANKYYRM